MTSARLHRFSATVEHGARLLSKSLALAGLGVLLLFAIATLCDGLLRHLINQPIELVRDSGGLVVAVTVVACFPLAMLSRSNISIKFIDLVLPNVISRILNAAASILVLLMMWRTTSSGLPPRYRLASTATSAAPRAITSPRGLRTAPCSNSLP